MGRLWMFGACAGLAVFLLHCSDDPSDSCGTGETCTTGGKDGICFSDTCVANVCVIENLPYADGRTNSLNGCQSCDVGNDQKGWTPLACKSNTEDPCRKSAGACDKDALGGACQGQECCKYEAAWDGQGTAPTCTYGGKTGTCDTNGQCAGVCTTATDCDTGDPCLSWSCSATGVCESSPQSGQTCDKDSVGDGVCVDGKCQKACADHTDCPSSHYCDGNLCLPDKDYGEPCGGGDECPSGFCEDGCAGGKHCTVVKCEDGKKADSTGACVDCGSKEDGPLPDKMQPDKMQPDKMQPDSAKDSGYVGSRPTAPDCGWRLTGLDRLYDDLRLTRLVAELPDMRSVAVMTYLGQL